MAKKTTKSDDVEIRNRVKELRMIPASEILPHPKNFRLHPDRQKNALLGILREVGVATACLVFKTKKNKYMLIDGHLRREELSKLGDQLIPCLITDLTEEEADKMLATMDPLAAWAETDPLALKTLLSGIETGDEYLANLFSEQLGAGERDAGLGLDVGDETKIATPGEAGDVEKSHVCMVQLFLDTTTEPLFRKYCQALGPMVGADNLTDVVLKVMKKAYLKHRKATKAGA